MSTLLVCALAVGEMAAASERVEEYRLKAAEFSKRLYDYLAIAFNAQVRFSGTV